MDNIDFRIQRLLLKSGSALNNSRLNDLKRYELTPSQSEAILFFADNDNKNIKDLAEHLKITHQAARKLVKKLKEKDILSTEVSAEDKRSVVVSLTDSGVTLCAKLKKRGASVGGVLLSELNEDEKKHLLEILEKIEKNIRSK